MTVRRHCPKPIIDKQMSSHLYMGRIKLELLLFDLLWICYTVQQIHNKSKDLPQAKPGCVVDLLLTLLFARNYRGRETGYIADQYIGLYLDAGSRQKIRKTL
jgi:hypothetical protein